MTAKKSEKKEENIIIEGSTNYEVEEMIKTLNSWSPIVYMQVIDFPNFISDISTAIRRMNTQASPNVRTKLLWFNVSSGLFQINLYSKKDIEDEEIKKTAPNGIQLVPIECESGAVPGRKVKYTLDKLLADYSMFEPSANSATNNPLHSSVLIINDIRKELDTNTSLKHSLIHFLQQTEVLFGRELVNRQVVIVDRAITSIPAELERSNIIYHHHGYTNQKMIESLVEDPENMDKKYKVIAEKMSNAMSGLTLTEAQSVINLMANRKTKSDKKELDILDLDESDINYLTHKRKEIINRGGILGVKDPIIEMKEIGGNELIKDFVQEVKYTYKNRYEAQKFGLHKQRGVLFLGPPGTGKSTICEAIAHELNAPYMILSLSKVMESKVGSTEANIETALSMAEKIGGVLQIDEIEKKLGGIESSNKVDGGITLRIFDTILKYMARENDVLFIATANDIKGLPPELTRKGRIDEIYLIDYPCIDEISEILNIHVSKSGRKLDDFLSEKEESKLIKMLDEFTGSEIRYVVNKALRKAFLSKDKKLTFSLFHDIIKDTVPMSRTYKETLDDVRDWAITVANPASKNSHFAKLRTSHTNN